MKYHNWQSMRLENFVSVQRGYDLPKSQRKAGNVPVIGSAGVNGYHNVAKAKAPGITIGRSGASIGVVTYSSVNYFPHNACLFVTDFHGNDEKFAYYLLQTIDFKSYNSGSAQPSLNRNYIYQIDIKVPLLPVQQKIASILSAYDDLIENNTRRIKILEEMAQLLYREWFVNFRFPGHQQVTMVESELGLIPQGWEVKRIKDVCERIEYGYTTSAKSENTGVKFLRITDIVPFVIDWDSVPYCEVSEKDSQKFSLEEGDIVIARTGATTGYAKRLNKKHPKSIFASYLVRIRVNQQCANSHFMGLTVESNTYKDFIKANLSGAAQPQANAQVLASFPIVLPSQEIQKKFKAVVADLLDQKEVLQQKNLNLRKTRDLLLPKLISGEIDVESLDAAMETEVGELAA